MSEANDELQAAHKLLREAYSTYGEKSSPSMLLPPISNPKLTAIMDAAHTAGYRVRVRNCSRYRGMLRVHLTPEAGKPEFRQMLSGL